MEKEKTILDYDTVALDEAQDAVIIIVNDSTADKA